MNKLQLFIRLLDRNKNYYDLIEFELKNQKYHIPVPIAIDNLKISKFKLLSKIDISKKKRDYKFFYCPICEEYSFYKCKICYEEYSLLFDKWQELTYNYKWKYQFFLKRVLKFPKRYNLKYIIAGDN